MVDRSNAAGSNTVVEGDPFGEIKEEKRFQSPDPRQVNGFHARSDCDARQTAQHHTIGVGHNQAAAGDHVHDGATTRKLGQGMGLTITGAKAGNTALTSLIQQLQRVVDIVDSSTA